MPRTGGLLSGARRSAAPGNAASSNRGNQSTASAELPPYEAPSCPIEDSAKRALSELSNNRAATRAYDKNLAQSAKYLATSVGQINDRVQRRRINAETAAERRQKKGHEKSEQEQENEDRLAELQNVVPELTSALEVSIRQVIDRRADLEDEKDVFKEVSRKVADRPPPVPRQPRQRQRRRQRDSDSEGEGPVDAADDVKMMEEEGLLRRPVLREGDEEEPVDPPIPGTVDLLAEVRASKRSAYEMLSAAERYSKNNDYIAFKRTWHDALHPDDDVPLPDPALWFDEEGNPVVDAEGVEDDDLVVEREVLSFKCPLSMGVMEEPYSSNKCKHTFEKESIMEYLRDGPKQCPQTGCSVQLHAKDMFFDESVSRKIKRAAEQARRNEMDATSDVDYDDDSQAGPRETGVRVVSKKAKKEPGTGNSSRRRVEEIEDELV